MSNIEINLRRHTVKPEKYGPEDVELTAQEGGAKLGLSAEGVKQAQHEGRAFAESIKNIEGAVVFGFVSNQARTQLADEVFGEELKHMAKEREKEGKEVGIYDLKTEKSLENIANKTKDKQGLDKIVILGSPQDEGLGMKSWDLSAYKAKNAELEKQGKPKIPEADMLAIYLGGVPDLEKKYGYTTKEAREGMKVKPETIAADYSYFIIKNIVKSRKLFPNRPVIITAIAHSFELDIAFLALTGRPLSGELMRRAGGMINEMEEIKIEIDDPNKPQDMKITYRGKTEEVKEGKRV